MSTRRPVGSRAPESRQAEDRGTVVIIGAGPRGTSVLERLCAHARSSAAVVDVHLIDPHVAGPGAVWRTDQSGELLMNTVLTEQTIFPDASTGLDSGGGPTMAAWAELVRSGEVDIAPEIRDDLLALPDPGFPTRRLHGAYLAWAFQHLVDSAPSGLSITVHRTRAVALLDPPSYNPQHDESQVVRLADGTELRADRVVLCLGHLPARPGPGRAELADYAQRGGLGYLAPSLPADVDLDAAAPPGAPVIVRGFGLNFFDLMALATTGRGGVFHEGAGRLEYRASGSEPVFWVGSRRGVPYRAKPIVPGHPMARIELRWTRTELLDPDPSRAPLSFNRDVWPSVLADLRWHFYRALAADRPGAFAGNTADFLDHIHPEPRAGFEQAERDAVPDQDDRMDLHQLINPLQDLEFSSREEFDAWMVAFLETDIARAERGADSPAKTVQAVLTSARLVIKELVAEGRIEETSFADELRGWFEDFCAGLCDGPPVERIRQVLALHRAGLLRFAGPAMRVDPATGTRERAFALSSPQIQAEPVWADHLIDAATPVNRVEWVDDQLLRSLLETGRVRARQTQLANGRLYTSSGLDVVGPAHQTVDAAGRVHPGRHVLGLQLSAVQWGLAIAAQPGTAARSLRDADAIARSVLGIG